MSELKPCPFCGNELIRTERRDKFSAGLITWFCTHCFSSSTNATDRGQWNTRPIEDELTARIAELEGKIDQLTAHDATERQDDKWIPVSERLPDNWKPVLTIDMSESTRVPVPAFYDPETSLWSTHLPNYDLWVTHWMPLPPNPESPNDTQTQTIVYGKEREE